MKFLTKSTKVKCIVASVVTALALITLVMLSSLLSISNTDKTTMTLIYTVSLMLVLLMWYGVVQIQVFNDYKSKNSWVCADGILSICISILLIVSGILLGVLQLDKIIAGTLTSTSDIRIFLTAFLAILGLWKIYVSARSIKEKRFNWWCEITGAIFWLALSAIVCATMFVVHVTPFLWVIIAFSWALIVLNIFYILFSYVIKCPNYLETEEAIKIKEDEEQEKEELKAEKNLIKNGSFRLQDKLRKLKELKDNDLITEEEYTTKKNKLLKEL